MMTLDEQDLGRQDKITMHWKDMKGMELWMVCVFSSILMEKGTVPLGA